MNQHYSRLPVFLTSLFLTITGLGGLAVVLINTVPTLGPRWLFYFFLFLLLAGCSLPVTDFLNRRFPSKPRASASVVIRQAVWFGLYGCVLAWLQFGRVLNSGLVLFLAIGLVTVEMIIRMNERSQFNTPSEEDE
ncbi:MAG: hypothetical protein GX577_10750 [Leptolinea sp.]|nr:hypothetical protein [Leptolinea sp.]